MQFSPRGVSVEHMEKCRAPKKDWGQNKVCNSLVWAKRHVSNLLFRED